MEVFGGPQADQGGYFAVVAVNWNDNEAKSLVLDLVEIGAADSAT